MKPIMQQAAITIQAINKRYRTGFWGRRYTALKDLSLELHPGEILGYLGPNGSGKTTTFKILLGLIKADSGSIKVFGEPADQRSRERIGFLPENPYFYMYLTAEESLHFHGRLKGMSREERKMSIQDLLPLVGLENAGSKQLRKFSRGMLQRIGIAQAMMNNPDILILDEPMSGLDPRGRKQMRDIIMHYRDQGKSVIFSSHILSDVEIMCDRAAMIEAGRLQEVVKVDEILDSQIEHWEIACTNLSDTATFTDRAFSILATKRQQLFKVTEEDSARAMLTEIEQAGGKLISFGPQRANLEDRLFNTSKN